MQKYTLAPNMYDWEHYHIPLNYYATSMGPIGRHTIIYNKADKYKSWDFRGRKGFSIGPSLNR